MYKKNCKNLFIGLDYKEAFTMDHYFEQKVKVNYRYNKTFTSTYIDEFGKKKIKSYSMYVRNENLCKSTKISKLLDNKLLKNKSLIKFKFKNILFSLIDLKKTSKKLLLILKKIKHIYFPCKGKIVKCPFKTHIQIWKKLLSQMVKII